MDFVVKKPSMNVWWTVLVCWRNGIAQSSRATTCAQITRRLSDMLGTTASLYRGDYWAVTGNQSGDGQVHEAGKLRKQQNAENHAHFRPDERVGDGYGKARSMAFVSILLRGNSQPGKGKRYAKEIKVSERTDCPQILLRTDWQALLDRV